MRSQNISSINPPAAGHSVRQKLLSGSLSLAVTGSFSVATGGALAYTSSPSHSFTPVAMSHSGASGAGQWTGPSAFPLSHFFHASTIAAPNSSASSPKATASRVASAWHSSTSSLRGLVNSAPTAGNLALNNGTAMFTAGSLAGFHTITIDIGGKEQTLNVNSHLAAAELVAAQQVLSGSKQDITINAKGVATGGYFDLNGSTVSALDTAVGGVITGLTVSHGVQAIDTLSNFSLTGSLINLGTIDLGAASGAKGQTVDTLSAGAIYNASGAIITSAPASTGLTGTDVSLTAGSSLTNAGTISSTGNLNVVAPTINNRAAAGSSQSQGVLLAAQNVNLQTATLTNGGLVDATAGNVNLANGLAGVNDITVNGAGGTVQALKGDINFNASANGAVGNVTASGGNWLSQQFNVNAAGGDNNVSVGALIGQVNITAGTSHLTAETSNLDLGVSNISGDPTYYNAAGNITINEALTTTGADLAIIASGNVIGASGGSINTAGGTLAIIAGANVTTTGSSLPVTPSTAAVTVSNNAAVAGNGSKTGGYIDLSGATLTGVGSGTALSQITTGGGNVTMVAYKGTGSNSGSIVATATAKQTTTGASTILDAGTGSVTLIGAGSQITAQNITASGGVTILASTPSISSGVLTAGTDGSITGAYSIPATLSSGKYTATAVNVTSINAGTGAVLISTAGAVNTVKDPLTLTAGTFSYAGTASGSSLYVNANSAGAAFTVAGVDMASGTTLSVTTGGDLNVTGSVSAGVSSATTGFITGGTVLLTSGGNLNVSAPTSNTIISGTTVDLTALNGNAITTTGQSLISATTSILTTSPSTGGTTSGNITASTAVNTLTVKSSASAVDIIESASLGKATSLLASTVGANGTFILSSTQPTTVSGALTATDGGTLSSVSFSESGVTTNTTDGTTTVAGLTIAAAINVNATSGTITLTTTGNENIAERSTVLTAPFMFINAAAGVGTLSSPIQTDATQSLTVTGSSVSPIAIKDLGTSTFNVSGSNTSGNPESIAISSKATTFDVGTLDFSNVTLTNAVAAASTTLGSGAVIGDGTGIVIVTTTGSITQADQTAYIQGQLVTLTSSSGSIGTNANAGLIVNSPILTANAVKESVYLTTDTLTTLNAGSALNTYEVTANQSLTLNGTIKATLAAGGNVSMTVNGAGNSITQNLATTNLSAATVNLNAGAGALIGNGIGFQSLQTKATTALTIDGAANSSSYITQNGSITLGTSSTGIGNAALNLALATGDKLTVNADINFTNLSITAPTSLTVASGGNITSANLTVTAPVVVMSAGGQIITTAGGSLSFVSGTTLTISGAGAINYGAGSSLSLAGQTGITLGTGTGASNTANPLSNIGGTPGGASSTLADLSIFTLGTFTGAYSQFILGNNSPTESLSITAASLKNSGTASLAPYLIESVGSSSNYINLSLTGSANMVIGTTAAEKGHAQEFAFLQGGTSGGSLNVLTGGTLTFDTTNGSPSGSSLVIDPSSGNAISLTARTLALSPLGAGYFSNNLFDSVSLKATTGTFTVGTLNASPTISNNGTLGSIAAATVNVSAPTGVTINSNYSVLGRQLAFNTASFKMDGLIEGTGTGNVINSLSLANFSGGSLTVVVDTTPGTYSNIQQLLLQSTAGSINAGNLFTSSSLLGNGVLDSVAISAGGSVTLPTTLYDLSVQSNGSIYINAVGLTYSPASSNMQNYLSFGAVGGNVTLELAKAVTLGQQKGDLDVSSVGPNGSYSLTSTAAVIVNEQLTTATASITADTITLKAPVTTSGAMLLQAQGNRSSIITSNGYEITAGTLTVGQGNAVLPSASKELNIDTGNIIVVNGALLLNNTFAGNVSISQTPIPQTLQLYALTLLNSSGSSTSTLTVGSLSTFFGSIDIVNSNGNIAVAQNANLSTSFGNIYIQNNDLINGSIMVQPDVTMHASGVFTELGQIYITMGPVPIVLVSLNGPTPGPDVPITRSSGGAQIFFTTTAHPLATITSIGQNVLDAAGRNVVFNGNGNSSAITLQGGDNITADPPPVAAAPVSAAASQNMVTATSVSSLASTYSTLSSTLSSAGSSNNAFSTSGANPFLNWTLPTLTAISAAQTGGTQDSTLLSDGVTLRGDTDAGSGGSVFGDTGTAKMLRGGVCNANVKTMYRGARLINPAEQTAINTDYGTVNVAPGSAALVMAFDGGVAVYNLHDTRSGAVSVLLRGSTIKLSPGQNILLTDEQIKSFEEINPVQAVAYRRMMAKEWGQGLHGFQSEFNLLSMLQSCDALKNLVKAPDAATRKTVDSILKTSAILMQLGGDPYERMTLPAATAMALK